jgi:hypothetical protein
MPFNAQPLAALEPIAKVIPQISSNPGKLPVCQPNPTCALREIL